jgi:hypothetical protein
VRRISIGSLMVTIVVLAVALAAIRIGSAPWMGAMVSITFFTMIGSFLSIALGRGMRRVYWSGFALLGWSYLLLVYIPALHSNVGQFLLAPNLFSYLEEILHPESPGGGMQSIPPALLGAAAQGGGFGGGPGGVEGFSDFIRIGVMMEALLWAFLGGWAAIYFASGRGQGDQRT